MKFKFAKELKNRAKYSHSEKRILVLKYIIKNLLRNCLSQENELFAKKVRYIISTKILYPSISKVQLVRRCVLTGRSRSSTRLLNISRIRLRELLKQGVVPGYSKYSW